MTVTVGGMAGAACAEWQLHAWDLARALGKDYRPASPETVLGGWRAGMPQLPVWVEARPGYSAGDPWHALLAASAVPRVELC